MCRCSDSYGFLKAKRSDDYITFFGKDRQYYAIKTQSLSVGKKGLEQAGVKTVQQEKKEAEDALKNPLDKAIEFGKKLIIGVAVVWAAGYLYQSIKK